MGRMTAVNHDKYFTLPVDNQTASVEMSSNVSVITSHDVIISLNYSVSAMVAVSVVLFVVNMVTAFGNLLVCVALVKYKQLRTVSNYLIGKYQYGCCLDLEIILRKAVVLQRWYIFAHRDKLAVCISNCR